MAADVLKAYIDKELGSKTPDEREILKEGLRDRTAMEVMQVCKLAKSCSVVNKEIFNDYPPVILMDHLTDHRKHVKEYDDK